jgi:hypothetical protein
MVCPSLFAAGATPGTRADPGPGASRPTKTRGSRRGFQPRAGPVPPEPPAAPRAFTAVEIVHGTWPALTGGPFLVTDRGRANIPATSRKVAFSLAWRTEQRGLA